jgi:hypothetical protein
MLSAHLVQMIEDHADELTRGVIDDLRTNHRTAHYHDLSADEVHRRTYDVYRHLGQWLGSKTEAAIESSYTDLAKRRYAEGVPLHEVVYALIQIKYHLREYIRFCGLTDSPVDLHRERELQRLVGEFFDKAIYYTVRAFEEEQGRHHPRRTVARAA